VTKYEIRLYGHGGYGKCEVSFNQKPTVKMVQDKVAFCLKEGSLRLHKERFYSISPDPILKSVPSFRSTVISHDSNVSGGSFG